MFGHLLLMCLLSCSSYAKLGPEHCERNVTMNNITNSIVYVPNGTVCFECVQAEYLALSFIFIIRDRIVNSSYPLAHTNNTDYSDILVVPNTGRVFRTSSATTVQCCEWMQGQSECATTSTALNLKATVFLYYAFNRPLISGETTVSEGDTLDLSCDGSNSDPLPTLHWVSPDGETVNDTGQLVIMDITRNITGMYTCVATLPNSTMTLNTTVTVTITEASDTVTVALVGVIVSVVLGILCIAGGVISAIAFVCFKKKHTKTKRELTLEENRAGDHTITFSNHSSCNELNLEPLDTTFRGQNDLYSVPRSVLVAAVDVQTTTEPSGLVHPGPEQTEEDQTKPYHTGEEVPVVEEEGEKYSVKNVVYSNVVKRTAVQASPVVDTGTEGLYDQPRPTQEKPISVGDQETFETVRPSTEPIQPAPPPPEAVTVKQTVKYAQVGIIPSPAPHTTPSADSDKVQYAALDHNAVIPDSTVCLDQILIQLKEVAPQWRRLGEAVGLEALDDIAEYVGGSESEAMVEVVDGWLANLHPDKPTWREIADVVESIGHHDLAHSLRQVYISGQLPILVCNAVAESVIFRKVPPPAVPARKPIKEELQPSPT